MYDDKLTEITNAINLAKAEKGERFTVKALERQRKSITQKIEKMRAAFKKDDFITFEEAHCQGGNQRHARCGASDLRYQRACIRRFTGAYPPVGAVQLP